MNFQSSRGNLYYNIVGEGKETFVLLHNAGGNSQFFIHQVDVLKQYGKVVTIDLLGHGQSDKPNDKYSLEDNAKDVLSLCESNNFQHFILIGLNYGANVGVEMANISDNIKALILIDPPICMNDKVVELVKGHIEHLKDDSVQNYAEDLVNDSFIHTIDANREIGKASFKAIPRQSLASLYEELIKWDKKSAKKLHSLKLPVLCIMTDAALCSAEEIKRHNSAIKVGKVVDSMYWATLEVPDQVNAMILRFISVLNTQNSVI